MNSVWQCGLLFLLLASSLAFGQESKNPTRQSGSSALEVSLTKPLVWRGNCLELSLKRTNISKSPIFLDATYPESIKVYSSVNDATNTLGQGTGEAWMLVYGWTDVVSKTISLAPGAKRQNTFCIGETFPVKETGKEKLRQVQLQGKLRILAEYGQKILSRRINKKPRDGRSDDWTFGKVMLEILIPCPNGISSSDCLSAPPIFPGEHDVWTIEPEPPPVIELQPSPLPTLPIHGPPPPKP